MGKYFFAETLLESQKDNIRHTTEKYQEVEGLTWDEDGDPLLKSQFSLASPHPGQDSSNTWLKSLTSYDAKSHCTSKQNRLQHS